MPDWFEGNPIKKEWFPPQTDEQRKFIGEFIATRGNPDLNVPRAVKVLEELGRTYAGVKRWAGVGFCWGAKVVSLLAAKGDGVPIDVGGQSSPARIDPEEAKRITIPMVFLPSGEEDVEVCETYFENLKGEKYTETFKGQCHGWMTAR